MNERKARAMQLAILAWADRSKATTPTALYQELQPLADMIGGYIAADLSTRGGTPKPSTIPVG